MSGGSFDDCPGHSTLISSHSSIPPDRDLHLFQRNRRGNSCQQRFRVALALRRRIRWPARQRDQRLYTPNEIYVGQWDAPTHARRNLVSGINTSRTCCCAFTACALALFTLLASSGWSLDASTDSDRIRVRARALGLKIGHLPPGPLNAITDVPGVKVGQVTLSRGDGPLKPGQGPVRTGVTVIVPRDDVWRKKVPAGAFVLNGTGEMTGLAWVSESGFLEYPIALTNTLNVPRVADGVISWMLRQYPGIGITDDTLTPVVAECDDSRLNDIQGRHVSEADVIQALDDASSGPVMEGSVGAGTGMISYGFKGGIGTASRRLPEVDGGFTVGVLVNANHGRRAELMMGGVLMGQRYDAERAQSSLLPDMKTESLLALVGGTAGNAEGSIIVIIATDAPLDGRQLTRLGKRAALGLARTGATARHGSGDFMLAFSTGNVIPHYPAEPTFSLTQLADTHLNPVIIATVEATEEAILNALTGATTVVGRDGHRAEAISISRLRALLSTGSTTSP
ncbi:MAG: P1 family peptidase [Nitrospira sp.]|nr:P1 family peptidase [Nitrospira sp.]